MIYTHLDLDIDLAISLDLVIKLSLDMVQEFLSVDPVLTGHGLAMQRQRQILGHDAILVDGLDTAVLQVLGEAGELLVVVSLGHEEQTAGPCKDRGLKSTISHLISTMSGCMAYDGVRAGLVTLLVFTVMTSDGSVSSLSFADLAVRCHELGRHETERAEALGGDIRDDISVVLKSFDLAVILLGRHCRAYVFQCQEVASVRLEHGMSALYITRAACVLTLIMKATASSIKRCSYQMPRASNSFL